MKFGEGNIKAGPGRPKGSPDKLTLSQKEAYDWCFNELGGGKGLLDWAKNKGNLSDFYKLYAKMLPTNMSTSVTFSHEDALAELEKIVKSNGEVK